MIFTMLARRATGHDGKMINWRDELTADCPRKRSARISDQCHTRRSSSAGATCEASTARRTHRRLPAQARRQR